MGAKVKCVYCGQRFDREKEECVTIPHGQVNRYAHIKCHEMFLNKADQKTQDEEELIEYIKQLFNYKKLPDKVTQTINRLIIDNGYTHNGILKSLRYFYEVKHGDKEKAHGNINIVPWIYQDAQNYYLNLWQIKQTNETFVKHEEVICPVVEVHIPPPERQTIIMRRRQFTFLDEEDDE